MNFNDRMSSLPDDVIKLILDEQSDEISKAYAAMTNPTIERVYSEERKTPFYWCNLILEEYCLVMPKPFTDDVLAVKDFYFLLDDVAYHRKDKCFEEEYDSKTKSKYLLRLIQLIRIVVLHLDQVWQTNGKHTNEQLYFVYLLKSLSFLYFSIVREHDLGIEFYLVLKESMLRYMKYIGSDKERPIEMDFKNVFCSNLENAFTSYLEKRLSLDEVRKQYSVYCTNFGEIISPSSKELSHVTCQKVAESVVKRLTFALSNFPECSKLFTWSMNSLSIVKILDKEYYRKNLSELNIERIKTARIMGKSRDILKRLEKDYGIDHNIETLVDFLIWLEYPGTQLTANFTDEFIPKIEREIFQNTGLIRKIQHAFLTERNTDMSINDLIRKSKPVRGVFVDIFISNESMSKKINILKMILGSNPTEEEIVKLVSESDYDHKEFLNWLKESDSFKTIDIERMCQQIEEMQAENNAIVEKEKTEESEDEVYDESEDVEDEEKVEDKVKYEVITRFLVEEFEEEFEEEEDSQ